MSRRIMQQLAVLFAVLLAYGGMCMYADALRADAVGEQSEAAVSAAQQRAERLEGILDQFQSVKQAVVTCDPACRQVQVTVVMDTALTAELEEAVSALASAHFPEAQVEVVQGEAG